MHVCIGTKKAPCFFRDPPESRPRRDTSRSWESSALEDSPASDMAFLRGIAMGKPWENPWF